MSARAWFWLGFGVFIAVALGGYAIGAWWDRRATGRPKIFG